MIFSLILIGLAVIILMWGVGLYNKLVRKRTQMEEGWSGIDVQLKKRYNLIPNLVETVKGYATHEKETLDAVISARNQALKADDIPSQRNAENQLNSALANVFALSEAYPDLKANTNFLQLQKELSSIEGDIEKARRYYNATVRENNIMIESFPSNLLAQSFSFEMGEYFELEDVGQRENPEVKF
jgi:LemA protein